MSDEITVLTPASSIVVELTSPERLYEKAARMAMDRAYNWFQIDENGNSDIVEGWFRCSCSVKLRQKSFEISGGMGGCTYTFVFEAWCERYDDDDEE